MTIMNDETREFVAMHRNEDVRELALKAKRVERLDLPSALDQIAGWQINLSNPAKWFQNSANSRFQIRSPIVMPPYKEHLPIIRKNMLCYIVPTGSPILPSIKKM